MPRQPLIETTPRTQPKKPEPNKAQTMKPTKYLMLLIAIQSFLLIPTAYPQSNLQFQYTHNFKAQNLESGKIHYSNPLNDPETKPLLTRNENQTILELQSPQANNELTPEDTQLTALRIIPLPNPTPKNLIVQVEVKKTSPNNTESWSTSKKSGIRIFFLKKEKRSRKATTLPTPPQWELVNKTISIPKDSDLAIIEIQTINGDQLTTKNWKIRLQ
jgi:hypothetical protein